MKQVLKVMDMIQRVFKRGKIKSIPVTHCSFVSYKTVKNTELDSELLILEKITSNSLHSWTIVTK